MNEFTVPLRFGVDLQVWAADYDIPLDEAQADVRQALTRAVEEGWLVALIAEAWPMMREHTITAGPVAAGVPAAEASGHPPRAEPHRPAVQPVGACTHRRVQVPHLAPVEVVVDTHAGTVDRVVLIDESVLADPRTGYRCNDCSTMLAADSPAVRAAQAIAAADQVEWPTWDHGW
jgi:hypothetical protein